MRGHGLVSILCRGGEARAAVSRMTGRRGRTSHDRASLDSEMRRVPRIPCVRFAPRPRPPPKRQRRLGGGAAAPSHLVPTASSPRTPFFASFPPPLSALRTSLSSLLRRCCLYALGRAEKHSCCGSAEDRDEKPPPRLSRVVVYRHIFCPPWLSRRSLRVRPRARSGQHLSIDLCRFCTAYFIRSAIAVGAEDRCVALLHGRAHRVDRDNRVSSEQL